MGGVSDMGERKARTVFTRTWGECLRGPGCAEASSARGRAAAAGGAAICSMKILAERGCWAACVYVRERGKVDGSAKEGNARERRLRWVGGMQGKKKETRSERGKKEGEKERERKRAA